jgi:glycosyltransferase involved in cell wall biosynthesis
MADIALISHQGFAAVNFRKTLIQLLIAKGHTVYVLAPDYKAEEMQAIRSFGATPIHYFLNRAGINPIADLIATLRLLKLLRKLKVDVSFSFSVKPVIFGSIAAYFAGVGSIVCMVEGLGYIFIDEAGVKYPSTLPPRESMLAWCARRGQWIYAGWKHTHRSLLKALVKNLYKMSMRLAGRVIFLNPDDMEYFIYSGIVEPGKCLNLGGIGVDLNEWAVVPISLEPVSFIMVARLLREKGVYEYIDAIRLLRPQYPSIRFYLVGSTDLNPGSVHADTLQEWITAGFVECPGHVEVRPWIERSSVFVLPSYREGVPRSTQEAMAMGRPVITTDAPGCRETVIENENGFLIPVGDAYALAAAMRKFIADPAIITKMGARSREIAEVRFDVVEKDAILLAQLLPFQMTTDVAETPGS